MKISIKTWQIELAVVAATLSTVAVLCGGRVELLGALAVTLSFAHVQVADRLAEREAAMSDTSESCYRWAVRYLVSKELAWVAYFVLLHAWSALAGAGIFIAYPLWRRWWRKRNPYVHPTDAAFEAMDAADREADALRKARDDEFERSEAFARHCARD